MSKSTALVVIAVLLFASVAHAARSVPESEGKLEVVEAAKAEKVEGCEAADEECLARRTLNAHVDYIYSQKTKP